VDIRDVVKSILLLLLAVASAAAQPVNLAGQWKLSLADQPRWAQPDADDSGWPVVNLPQRTPRNERIYWLRRTVPALTRTGQFRVAVGLVSESYEIYANAVRIGDTGDFGKLEVSFFQPRSFYLPPESIRSGSPMVICLRIWNTGARWGSLTSGLADRGPYWITTAEHANAEVDAARKGLRLALTPALVVITGECGIGVCLLLLWLAERERRELLYFAAYLIATGFSLALGIWVAFTGASSFWYRIGFRPLNDVAFLLLCLAAAVFLHLQQLRWPILVGAAVVSVALTFRTNYYLYPWLILLAWQCGGALRKSARKNLPFALPLLLYALAILNNTMRPDVRIVPASIGLAGMTLSVTNLIQLVFAGAMLILMLERLSSDRREKLRLASELEAAREIQRSLLPQAAPAIEGYCIGFRSIACYEVGGDYLDVFALPSGEQVMVVADIAGKGLAAALVGAAFRSAFRAAAEVGGASLCDLAARISQQHWNEGPEARRRYVTAILLKLDPVHHCINVVNAGHNAGFVVQAEDVVHMIEASGPPLGILPGVRYSAETLPFPEGSRLLLYTDGITEVFREGDEEFGPERLLEHFRECRERDCDRMLDSVWQALKIFAGEIRQRDDMTALALYRTQSL
jgi:serine phosphatase RsbU (regulator of sigma subunit)